MVHKKKKEGYVLAMVLILTLLMSVTILTTFTIVYRYVRFSKLHIEDLRDEVYVPTNNESNITITFGEV
jgi:Tfp pilus assembly protein PilX